MPVVEKNSLMKYKDKSGNTYILYPVTNADNVDGLDEMIDEAKKLGTAVAATSTDGVAYSATVPGITALTAGDSFIMIPNTISTSRSTTLNVNNLGAKYLRVRVSGYSGTTSAPQTINWLAPNVPVRVTYEGEWWLADVVLPSAQQLYGNVQAEQVDYSNTNSGMTATDVQAAIDELSNDKTSTKVMTTAEYNALTDKNENTLYMLSDAEDENNAVQYIENAVSVVLPTDATNTTWDSVCYGGGKFVAISSFNKIIVCSSDGINWTQVTMPVNKYWQSVCYGNGKFVTVALNSNIAAYSEDGITWTQTTLPASGNWYSVCYGNGKFVAMTLSSNIAAYSTDGITWTQVTMPASGKWYSVCYGNGKFVAVSYDSNIAAYSEDGITWTQNTMPVNTYWQSICYGNGKFVVVVYGSNIAAYSTDGINWTQTTMPVNTFWQAVCYGNGKFVAMSMEGIVICSHDGVAWSRTFATHKLQNAAGEDISDGVREAIGAATTDYVDNAIAAKDPDYTYGTTDLTAGTSTLETGKLYFVYE